MRISDWSSDVCSSDLYLLTALDAMDPHLLTAVVFLNGIVIGFNQPSRLALVPSLVPPEHLSTAVAINSILFNLARFIGPAIAGVLIAASGLESAFAVNARSEERRVGKRVWQYV